MEKYKILQTVSELLIEHPASYFVPIIFKLKLCLVTALVGIFTKVLNGPVKVIQLDIDMC